MAVYANGQVPRSVMKTFRNTGKYGHPDFIPRLDAAFTAVSKELGINLYIASGQDIFRDYASQVYWKSYWTKQGKPGNAAAPGFSNHGLGVCADISPMPARGTASFNRIAAIFARWNLKFSVASENWHVQDMNISVAGNKVTVNSSGGNGAYSGNRWFPSLAQFAAVQNGYRAIGYNIVADGLDGPATQAAVKDFQRKHGLPVDGIHGPATEKALVAAQPKPKPTTPSAPKFPLAKGQYFGPKSGPANSISGYFSHREDLKRWQQRMKDRGWNITVDGLYGDGTARVAKAFQKQLGITQDGLIGATTWAKAWTAPVT